MKNLFFLLLVCLPCAAERIECLATADTWISMHRWEGPKSDRKEALEAHGADAALVIQGRTAFALIALSALSLALLAWGRSPAMLLELMPVAAGVAFGVVFLSWLVAMRASHFGDTTDGPS